MDVSRAFLRSVSLKRDTYVKLHDWVGNGNAACKLLKPLYGVSIAYKCRYETIRDFLAKECGWEVASLDKSVFCWARQWFEYGLGGVISRLQSNKYG